MSVNHHGIMVTSVQAVRTTCVKGNSEQDPNVPYFKVEKEERREGAPLLSVCTVPTLGLVWAIRFNHAISVKHSSSLQIWS